jgi:hypothetical protein
VVDETEDPAQETMSKVSRVAVTAASMAVQAIAKQREQRARELAEAEADRTKELQSRWDSERAAAQVQLSTADDAWLVRASPEEVAEAWQTATVWAEFEPDAFADTESRLAAEIERRYGIDPRTAGRDVGGNTHALADAERAREREHDEAARDAGVRREAAERDDEIGAGIVMGGAAQDAAAEQATELGSAAAHGRAANALDVDAHGIAYDSDARRSALAERAERGGGEPDAVKARVVASNANGKPGRQATSVKGRPAAQPRALRSTLARDFGIER